MTEDKMVVWYHQLNGHKFKQTPEDGKGQGSLACCMQSMGSQRVGHSWATEQQHQQHVDKHRTKKKIENLPQKMALVWKELKCKLWHLEQ